MFVHAAIKQGNLLTDIANESCLPKLQGAKNPFTLYVCCHFPVLEIILGERKRQCCCAGCSVRRICDMYLLEWSLNISFLAEDKLALYTADDIRKVLLSDIALILYHYRVFVSEIVCFRISNLLKHVVCLINKKHEESEEGLI